jgi:alkaline phosphatase D
MTISKRAFLGGSAAAAMTAKVATPVWAQSLTGKPRLMEGPMIGAVTSDTALIWVRTNGAYNVQVSISETREMTAPRQTPVVLARAEDDFTVRVRVSDLKPDTRYTYRVLVNGVLDDYANDTELLWFRTAPRPGAKGQFRVAFGSCARIQADRIQPIWTSIESAKPDLFFWLGDNVYVDSLNPLSFAEEYRRQRSVANAQVLMQTVPQLAIWDDHDYGLNDHDRNNPMKNAALAAFQQYWANPSYGLPDTPGVFFKYSFGDIDFFFLDGRMYRDPNKSPGSATKTMLGTQQYAWLTDGLKASKAVFKVLVSGGGWSVGKGPAGDAWSAFTDERNRLFNFIRDEKVNGVVLLSGDTHVAELNCIPWSDKGGYDLYDLTSSPLAQRTETSWMERRPEVRIRQVFFNDSNFGLLNFDTTGDPHLTYNVFDPRGHAAWATFELKASELVNGVASWRRKIDKTSLERHERWQAGGAYYP